jgi:hypothetical protein
MMGVEQHDAASDGALVAPPAPPIHPPPPRSLRPQFAPLQDGIAVVGEQLMQAAQAVVEVLPELKFWEDEEEYYYEDGRPSGRDDPDEVVAASGAAAAHVKRRGASLGGSRSTPGRGRSLEEEETPTSELVGKED